MKTKNSSVNIRIEEKLKENVHKIFSDNDLSVSEGIRYLYKMVKDNPKLLSDKKAGGWKWKKRKRKY